MRIPILQYKQVLLTALQEDLTDRDALDLQTDLMEAIEAQRPFGVIIDLRSVAEIDSYLIGVVKETSEMAQLLGCETVVSGIQPAVAISLTELTGNRVYFKTLLNLEESVEYLLEKHAAIESMA